MSDFDHWLKTDSKPSLGRTLGDEKPKVGAKRPPDFETTIRALFKEGAQASQGTAPTPEVVRTKEDVEILTRAARLPGEGSNPRVAGQNRRRDFLDREHPLVTKEEPKMSVDERCVNGRRASRKSSAKRSPSPLRMRNCLRLRATVSMLSWPSSTRARSAKPRRHRSARRRA
jgi:hypothetical protein